MGVRLFGWASRVVWLCAFILGLAVLAPGAAAESLLSARGGYVAPGEWLAFPLPTARGALYEVTLNPNQDDADLYLLRGGQTVALSLQAGTSMDRLTWRADADGEVTVWVHGFGAGTTFDLSARRVPEGPAKRVGLQVGHWRNWEAPAPYNRNHGASGGGKTEAEVNLAIAQHAAAILRDRGYEVDLLPTWFPKGYKADVVVAIHADGSTNTSRRGFFADRPVRSPVAGAEELLCKILNEEYAKVTGLTYVNRSTVNTRYYYGYYRVHSHTPMVIIETGFLTSPADRRIIGDRPDLSGLGIANSIDRFLSR